MEEINLIFVLQCWRGGKGSRNDIFRLRIGSGALGFAEKISFHLPFSDESHQLQANTVSLGRAVRSREPSHLCNAMRGK